MLRYLVGLPGTLLGRAIESILEGINSGLRHVRDAGRQRVILRHNRCEWGATLVMEI